MPSWGQKVALGSGWRCALYALFPHPCFKIEDEKEMCTCDCQQLTKYTKRMHRIWLLCPPRWRLPQMFLCYCRTLLGCKRVEIGVRYARTDCLLHLFALKKKKKRPQEKKKGKKTKVEKMVSDRDKMYCNRQARVSAACSVTQLRAQPISAEISVSDKHQ